MVKHAMQVFSRSSHKELARSRPLSWSSKKLIFPNVCMPEESRPKLKHSFTKRNTEELNNDTKACN